MYKLFPLFTLALFALVLSACGGPPAPLSDSCRTFNPFAADCTGEDADEVQRLTCIFNPGFHSSCRGNTGVIADYCTDPNNPANAFNDSCAVELTADSLTAAHRAACLINPEASDICTELLVDFCTDPDDPFHSGCRTTVGIGLKQADACMANPFAHSTCTDLLTTLCDGTGDYANIYHSLCNDVETIAYSRAFNCSIDRVPLAICQPAYITYCSSVHVDTNGVPQFSFLNSFDEICDNLENLELVRFNVCTRGFTETDATPFECISFLDDYCARAANELLLFGATCENGLPFNKARQLRGMACVKNGNIDTIGENDCPQYVMDYCDINPFVKTLDSDCGGTQGRDTARGVKVDACLNLASPLQECEQAFNFCRADASDTSCVGKIIRPIVYEGQSSFQSIPLLHSEPGNENRFLFGAPDEGGLRTGSNDATPQDVENLVLRTEGGTSHGVGFFTGQGNDGVAYYYAGILLQTSLGQYLTQATAEGTWNGTFGAVVGDTVMEEMTMELGVNFATKSISTFVHAGNNHFLLEGRFNQNGVIEGTVNYGAFTANTRTPVAGRATNGTLIGLIGDYGAVGAFISTATGSAGYAGGFVVQRSSE